MHMKHIVSWSALFALALAPSSALADGPSETDRQNASKQCKQLRSGMGTTAFNQLYGANKNDKNAFGKCVSKFAREEKGERKAAKENAAKQCKAERTADEQAFRETYGTGPKMRNAYGKCVSQKAKANKDEADAADKRQDEARINAAKACRAEQKADPDAFKEKYGTGARKRNAFGRCVSAQAKAQNDEATA